MIFLSTLNQMAFLFLLIVIGYLLSRTGAVPSDTERTLSKMENAVFIPALVMGTFMENFTIHKIGVAGQYLLAGFAVAAGMTLISHLLSCLTIPVVFLLFDLVML